MINLVVGALFITFLLGQLGRFPLSFPGLAIQLNDLAVGLIFLGWVVIQIRQRKKIIWPPLVKPILIFSSLAFLSLLVNFGNFKLDEILVGSFYLLRWVTYAGLYLVVFNFLQAQKKPDLKTEKITNLMIMIGVLMAIVGLLQYAFYPNLRNLFYLGWDPHYFRLFGTLLDPNFMGIILVFTFLLIFVKFFEKSFSFKTQRWLILTLLVVFAALVLTFSRSSYLALVGGIFTIFLIKRNFKIFGIFSVLGGVLILVAFLRLIFYAPTLPERTASTKARVDSWKQALVIIKNHPVFGIGFNTYRFEQNRLGFLIREDWQTDHAGAGTDSGLLFVWATTGIFGLAAYLWLWWRIIKLSIINHKSSTSIALLCSIIAIFIHSFFVNSLFYPWVMEWMWILAGISSFRDYT